MKEHLKVYLDNLKPWIATEFMDKCKSVEWAFEQGYKYRKTLELKYFYGGNEKDIIFFNSYSRKWEVTAYGQKRLSELNKGKV